jgi:hypothetical protein
MTALTAGEETMRPAGASPGGAGGLADARPSLREWLDLGLRVQSIYDDNIFLTPDDEVDDWIFRVTPWLRAVSGGGGSARWVAEGTYAPTLTTYASGSSDSSFDHAMAAALRYNGRRVRASSTLFYRESTANDRFVRDILQTTASGLDLVFNYEVSGKTSVHTRFLWLDLEREDDGTRTFNDEETLSLQVGALWQATGKTRIGPSLRVGDTSADLNPDRTFVELLLRADHHSTGKLSFTGEAGVQGNFYDGGYESRWTPSASLAVRYAIDSAWELVLNGYSRNTPSPDLVNSDLQATGLNGFLRWMPQSWFHVSAGGGYEAARYESLDGDRDRSDDYAYGELRLGLGSGEKPLTADVFYRYRLTDSSDADQDFENNQAGVSLGVRY